MTGPRTRETDPHGIDSPVIVRGEVEVVEGIDGIFRTISR